MKKAYVIAACVKEKKHETKLIAAAIIVQTQS
jgi:hypothetical protein